MSIWSDIVRAVTEGARRSSTAETSSAATPTHGAPPRATSRREERPIEREVERAPLSAGARVRADGTRDSDDFAGWQRRVLDLLSDGVLIFDAEGEVVYRNATATVLLTGASAPLIRESRALARAALARTVLQPGGRPRAASADGHSELVVGGIPYRLGSALLPAHAMESDLPTSGAPIVLVTIARTSSALPSIAALRERFQLTGREATVALLLAEGRSNGSIARRLGITVSTARHYTETVLLKLGIPSRAAVAAVLLGIYEHTDEHRVPREHPSSPRGR